MKARKLIALSMTAAMVLGLSGGAAYAEEASAVSIDFEDGLYGFVGNDKTINSAAADATFSLVDYNGSTALEVASDASVKYVAIQVDALLGDQISQLSTVQMTVGTTNPGGTFYSTAGCIYAFLGENLDKDYSEWSIYMESGNPKTISYTLDPDDGLSFVEGSYIVVSLEDDTGKDYKGDEAATLYIDDITFLDADGNVLTADTTAEYVSAAAEDRSNLFAVSNAVEFEGFATSGDGWSQDGFDMTEEILAALVPGSVVEITYSSENGDIWLVMPDAEAGWMRVGVGNYDGSGSDSAYYNGSANIAQITYEQIAAVCGDDVSTWGARMQCEASGAWEVYNVKVGTASNQLVALNAVEFEGFATSGGGWSQAGFDMPQEIIDALVPGSVVEITYTSENGEIWLVMPSAEAGWMRVGVGDWDGSGSDSGVYDGSTCYITYEQIAAVCGDDVSTWGARMQCEASGAWEVYNVKVGTASNQLVALNAVEFEGFATSGGGWSQAGFDMPQEIIDALVPGSVVEITYTSENGEIWLVMPSAEAGWMRVGVGNWDGSGSDSSVYNGTTCQVTYEQIAAVCGDDVSTWGATMQCEASGAWEVYSVTVGTAAE
ncbi:MAG: hypothetical protein LUG56_05885 [Lachnospiraceae bacterium]|nr:hypothetical protein [Lachnospiraceae bacterium]